MVNFNTCTRQVLFSLYLIVVILVIVYGYNQCMNFDQTQVCYQMIVSCLFVYFFISTCNASYSYASYFLPYRYTCDNSLDKN